MRYLLPLSFLLLLTFTACEIPEPDQQQRLATEFLASQNMDRYLLPNGWSLTPVGKQLPVGDLPLNAVISKDQKFAVITNNGQSRHSLMIIDLEGEQVTDELEIPKGWLGLALTDDGKTLYASGGNDNMVRTYQIENHKITPLDSIVIGAPWPNDTISVAGMALDESRNLLYTVTKEDSTLYILDTEKKEVKDKFQLDAAAYTCLLSEDQNTLYISLWGGSSVAIFDVESNRISNKIPVGYHPNDMVLSQDQQHLFVACSDENAVAVIDLKAGKEVERIITALHPEAPTGSTSNGLALSEDGKTLLIANADNNCLAVFDIETIGKSRSLGYIPTGWYPSDVEIAGNKILVLNGKGLESKPNSENGPNPYERRTDETQYIGSMFKGTASLFAMPDANTLAIYSQLVFDNTPYTKAKELKAEGEEGNPIPMEVGGSSPIKYVFYVVKENRTYDQVFGDIPGANGDPSICLFPDSVTPNQHALALEYVLLDNFYVDAEVSADGHSWTTAAYATDYAEKTWPTLYGGRGGTYDYEGSREIAYPKDGYIWDYCNRAGISYRTYGIFANLNKTYLETLKGHTCGRFPGYDTAIKDIFRQEQWRIDFDSLAAINALPRFNTIRFGNDHTAGTRIGYPTPSAMVADNDLAVGRFVEHISNSSIWSESVIFILEDDAQNGPDHVDAHRSILMVVSPYTKRKHKESTMYSTASVLRTIELILGLPPMSQYDAAATPLYACFTKEADLSPFKARPNQIDLDEMNVEENRLSMLSEQMNLDLEDQAPDELLNEVIWKAIRGLDSKVPAPRRSAFVKLGEESDDD